MTMNLAARFLKGNPLGVRFAINAFIGTTALWLLSDVSDRRQPNLVNIVDDHGDRTSGERCGTNVPDSVAQRAGWVRRGFQRANRRRIDRMEAADRHITRDTRFNLRRARRDYVAAGGSDRRNRNRLRAAL